MIKPKAVLISDIHFTTSTLELATYSLLQAIAKAKELRVPLIIAGDTLDSKAIMRAECVNRLINIFENCDYLENIYILVGNHDLLNEKGTEHSLEFLKPYINVIQAPLTLDNLNLVLVPYHSDNIALKRLIDTLKPESTIICHQGVQTAYMGHYNQDKSSLEKEVFANFRTISGHYHRRQDIKCGRPRKGAIGLFSYIGNPYTLSFNEASDGQKGFQVLNNNGFLDFIHLNLRKHIVIKRSFAELNNPVLDVNENDLIFLKITGLNSELDTINKQELGTVLFGHNNYKLELILEKSKSATIRQIDLISESDIFDSIIDNIKDTLERKTYLKILWRDLLDENS